MKKIIFYSEYSDTLELFFSHIISSLRQTGVVVHTIIQNKDSLHDVAELSVPSPFKHFLARCLRIPKVFFSSFHAARFHPNAIHVYVLPVHIILSPLIFLFLRHRYVIVCQGQLEGEGYLISSIYRLFLSFAVRLSLISFSCNLFETFRWHTWPYSYLSRFMQPLPWYGLTLSRTKQVQFSSFSFLPSNDPFPPLTFGYLGRINYAKGCHRLIDFFLQPQNRDYHLNISGFVESSFNLNLIAMASSSSNIHFGSCIPSASIHQWFESIDIFITFSSGESIGAATIESLLAGKPVISMIN